MIPWLTEQALRRRLLVLASVGVVLFAGVWSFQHQLIDAYPDISAQTVVVIATYPGKAPEEVERQVTAPIELAIGGCPKVNVVRSRTMFGLSVIQVQFEEGTELYWARQRVKERLDGAGLPTGASAELGPVGTGFGEIYRYELRGDGDCDTMELRTLNDWVVIPALRRVPGVSDVTNFGGRAKQYTVTLDPMRLERLGISLRDVIQAIQTNNANAGGGVVRRGEMSLVIRGRGSFQSLADIERSVINTVDGTPVTLRDVADVGYDFQVPNGVFSINDDADAVEGAVLMRRGENTSRTIERVKAEVERLNKESLPPTIRIVPFYDRTELVNSTLRTVAHSVLEGILLVSLVLLLFWGSPLIAAIVVATIPFALLVAVSLMYASGIPIGLLAIGAIDFGIIVDGAVIMTDNIAEHLTHAERRGERRGLIPAIRNAAHEIQRPMFFSMLIIIGAYLPLLSLGGIEGLLFRPMALTVIFALLGAVIFGLFVAPVLASYLLASGFEEWENPVLTWIRPRYASILRGLLRARYAVALAALVSVATVIGLVVPRMGTEFLPYLDEGTIWVRANFPEGMALDQTAAHGNEMRRIIRWFPEVTMVMGQAGRNDTGTDPFPPSRLEMMVGLRPREEWTVGSKQELVARMGRRLRDSFPTTRFNFTQPIIDSVTEETNGTSANLAVELSGGEPEELLELARQTKAMLEKVPGALDVAIEQEGPQPQLIIQPDRAKCARYDVHIDDVNELINVALGGQPLGALYEGQRRFDIVAKFDRLLMTSTDAIGRLPVFSSHGVPIPLLQVATFDIVDGQTLIARENGRRRLTVRTDIVGRDQGGFAREAQRMFNEKVKLPTGCQVRWLGLFDNMERAQRHLLFVMPLTVGVIFTFLVVTFGSLREAALVLMAVPFAFIGGTLALYARGMNFNVSAGVGFTALFGVAMMNGVVLTQWIGMRRRQGLSLDEAIVESACSRLRPIMTTSMVAILGLFPASIATGLGSDVQRPLATVIVWGLVSSVVLTLFIVPVLYRVIAKPDRPRVDEARHDQDDEPDILSS